MNLLNFAGPYQVFETASRLAESTNEVFDLVSIGTSLEPVPVCAGAMLLPQVAIDDHPTLSCLLVAGPAEPGLSGDTRLIEWIKAQATTVPIIASVGTGVCLLAETGLLDGLEATTHRDHADLMRRHFPNIDIIESRRWVNAGQFVTSAGFSAGIDMAIHLVERMTSHTLAVATARVLEL
jgi:transcriptional regulator GlxA family with amidase domain